MSNLIKDTANQTFHAPVAKRTVAQLSDGSVVALIYDQNIAGGGGSTAPPSSGGGGGGGGGTVTSRSWSIVTGPMGEGTTIGTAAALSWVPGNSTNFATTVDLRQPVCMEMCFQIVSTAENSTTQWWVGVYDYIEDIGDQRGYTGGLIGFTSATADMEDLVQRYVALVPGSPLAAYINGLHQCTLVGYGAGATNAANTYLGNGFKTAWANAANNDPIFRRLQREMRKEIYWDDALAQALADGVGPLGLALHYDILVNHGPGNDSESYGGILAAARASNRKPPSAGGNEAQYLIKLCDLRDAVLQGWGDYQEDGRSTIFRGLVAANKLSLIAPYSWSCYGEPYTMNSRPTPSPDSALGDFTLRYTAVGAGSDDMIVHVNASGSTNQGTSGAAGTLSAGTDATILAGQTLTRTATEPAGSGGGGGGGGGTSQTVFVPSDGTNVGKWYLYHSVDRLTWTLKSTVTPTTAPAVAGEYCIYSMTADASDNVYLAFGGRDQSVRFYRWMTGGSGTSRTFTASAQETAMAAPGISNYILRLDMDVLTGTSCALIALQWRNGTNMGYRFLVRRLQDNTWVTAYTYTVWTNQANPQWADISVAWDSNNSSATDENGRTWFALYLSKISTTQDFGDDVVQWALNPTTGAQSSVVTSSQQTSNNLNINLGGKVRRGCLFSTAPGRYTLLGGVGTSNFFSFVLTFTNGGSQPVPYVRSQQTGITINKLVSGANDVGFAWQDYRAIVAYGGTDGRAYAHVYTFTTGNTTPTTSTTNYAFDNFFRNGNSRYAAWFCGGSNRYAWSLFKKLDMIVWDAPSGDNAAGSRAWRHHYNIAPVAPKVVTPSAGSQVTSNIPALTADVDLDLDYPQSKVKVVWQVARDNLFTQNLRTIEEPDVNFRYLTMSGSTSAVTKVSSQVPVDSALFTGTWYIRAAFISELGLQGAWSTTQSFFVGHPASGKDLHPSGDEFWTFNTPTVFNWVFTDTAEGDYQTAYQIIVESADTGGVLYNTGKVTSANPVGTVAIAEQYKDVQLRWRLKLWDMDDTEGSFSDYQTFYLGDGPVVDIFAPADGAVVATPTPVVEWSVDLEGWRVLKSFRVVGRRTVGDFIDYDSGWRQIGAAAPYTFLVDNPTGLDNNQAYDLYVYVRDIKGLEGGDHVQITTSWIPPNPPAFTVNGSLFTEQGYVTIFWNNSSQDDTWTAWRIYRRVFNYDLQGFTDWVLLKEYTNASSSYSYQDWSAPANSNVQYAVVQVATRFEAPVESVYNAQSLNTTNSDYWLINPLDSTQNLRVSMNTEGFQDEYEQEVYHVLGRGRHVDQGDRLGYSGSFTIRFRDKLGNSARQQRLAFDSVIKRQLPLYLRSPFGDVTYVVLMNASYERVPGMGEHEAVDVSCDYVEVAL